MPPYRAFVRSALHTKSSSPHPSRSVSSQALHSRQSSHILTSILAPGPTPSYHSSGRILAAVRAFSTTQSRARDHHFDTLKFVQRLKDEGFSEEQSKAMMLVLSDVIEESIQNLTRTMVLREGVLLPHTSRSLPRFTLPNITLSLPLFLSYCTDTQHRFVDADRSTYTQKVDFTKLRSELLAQDSNETSTTTAAYERLSNDIAKLNSRVRDEISRAQASVKLDLNLEKGRIREEAKGQELKIKETETRIEEVAAGLKERVEAVKFSTLQWLM